MNVLLRANGLALRHGDIIAIDDVALDICAGEFVGVIGPNGAGKSSLLSILAGVTQPDTGAIAIDGRDSATLTPIERAQRIAYLPQARPVHWSLPVRDLIALGRFAYGGPALRRQEDESAVESAISRLDLRALQHRPAHALSGGELTRAHLARLLASSAPIIIADEPTTALDPARGFDVMEILRERAQNGGAVIAAIHDLPMAMRYCSRLVVLSNGRIVGDGEPGAIAEAGLFERAFDVRLIAAPENAPESFSVEPIA